jgi:4-amino-4-deoxy-L-arabinose transferase-like glycosyltransferase
VIAGRPASSALRGALRADPSPRAPRIQTAAAGGHDASQAGTSFRQRHGVGLWIAAGVLLALLLRAPWFQAALGLDEGGVTLISQSWHSGGPFAYGSYFLDRPPLLVGLYSIFGAHGPGGIRVLGALAASLLVVTTTLLAVRLGGRRAAPFAAVMAGVLASSSELTAVFTPAELLAAVPSSASVLLLVIALERQPRRLWLLAGAGALAAAALLVKQSFADALAAGAVALVGAKVSGVSWRETLRRSAAYAGGVLLVALALGVWAWATHVRAGAVYYALFGFRADAAASLVQHHPLTKALGLALPALTSGLAVALVFSAAWLARRRERSLVRVVVAAWLLAGAVGILLGGSYWRHYLIELVPGSVAAAAALFANHRRIGSLVAVSVVVPAALMAIVGAAGPNVNLKQQDSVIVGHYVRARALPGQTFHVIYAHVNVIYYSGMRDPFPYNWSLMMRSVPHVQDRLRRLLASPSRPTWVVDWQTTRGFGLDRTGATKRALARYYRPVTTVCGHPLLLARGAPSRHVSPAARRCLPASQS